MTSSLPRVLGGAIVTIGAVAALLASPAPEANAFDVGYHERIVRDALPPDQVDGIAMTQVLTGPPPGLGAVSSDVQAGDEWRHFDNAKDPADVCARARKAWDVFVPSLSAGAQPAGPGYTVLANGPAARSAFGGLAHALADFYAHSNWVELNVASGQPEQPGPQIFPTCDPAALPSGLHTGFFSLLYGPTGCPFGGPPPGFDQCHSSLNKDNPFSAEGRIPVPGTGMNQFDLARTLATRATTELYGQVRDLVVSTVAAQHPDADAECVARKLFDAGLQPCAKADAVPFGFRAPLGG